jgi:hypothetical protein
MLKFLRLAGENQDRLAVALHEYSYDVDDIGRFTSSDRSLPVSTPGTATALAADHSDHRVGWTYNTSLTGSGHGRHPLGGPPLCRLSTGRGGYLVSKIRRGVEDQTAGVDRSVRNYSLPLFRR